jgi:hypothetical protein
LSHLRSAKPTTLGERCSEAKSSLAEAKCSYGLLRDLASASTLARSTPISDDAAVRLVIVNAVTLSRVRN